MIPVTKIKLAIVEKHFLRSLLVFALIQAIIILLCIYLFKTSQPNDVSDLTEVEITVQDVFRFKPTSKGVWLVVVADSEEYLFKNSRAKGDYSVNRIYKSISAGDRLAIKYYREKFNIAGKTNIVVDAVTPSETLRSVEQYNKEAPIRYAFIAVFLSVAELIFGGCMFVYIWCSKSTVKSLRKKLNKSRNLKNKLNT